MYDLSEVIKVNIYDIKAILKEFKRENGDFLDK